MMVANRKKCLQALLLTMMLTAGSSIPVMADRLSTVTMEQAQQDIRARIQYGLSNGSITPREAQAFYRRERDIQFREMRYRRDPHASPRERQALWREIEAMRMDVDRKLNRHDGRNANATLAQRQLHINALIDRGIADGLIARGEAQWLQQRQREISRREALLQTGGRLSGWERERLHRDLDALEWDVNRLLDRAGHYR